MTKLQNALDRAVAPGGIPGILAEVRDNDTRWFGTAGVADTATGRQFQPQDRFRVGSTTKAFTATVVLQLDAERKLNLDDTVERWLPGLVTGNGNDGSKISIRQLLNQTSGLVNYGEDPELGSRVVGSAFPEHRQDSYRPEQLVGVAMAHPPHFAPGAGFRYSNTNYFLAAMIAERATGTALAQLITERITGPLGLDGTYLPGGETAIHGPHGRAYTTAFVPGPDAPVYDATDLDASFAWAAGGVVSTVVDLNAFFGALLAGKLLPAEQQAQMFTTVSTEGSGWIPGTRYGLGVFSQTLPCGRTVWGNGGAIFGSWNYVMGTRDGSHTLACGVNGDWGDLLGTFQDVLQAEFC